MMKRFHRSTTMLVAAFLLAAFSSFGIAAAKSNLTSQPRAASKQIRLEIAKVFVEVNATDGDAGLQVFLDGDPWRSMTISSPKRRTILALNAQGSLKGYGLTELFSESSEPSFDVFPLKKFKALFPEGNYTFAGTTVKGETLVGRATLTHDIPDGPKIISPKDGAAVARGSAVVRWDSVREPPGIDVVGYRAIVTQENPLRLFSVDLSASAKRVRIPSEFLKSGTEYKLEVQAIEASGNQTLTEITFRVK